MENETRILAKELIRHVATNAIRGTRDMVEGELLEAFNNAMRAKIIPKLQQRKREMQLLPSESFLGAVGHALGHAAAHQVATGLGVSASSVHKLGAALLTPSKKPTAKMVASKKPTAKKKKNKSAINAPQTASAPQAASAPPLTKQSLQKPGNPMSSKAQKRISHVAKLHSHLMSSTATTAKPTAATYTVASIQKFKNANRQKIAKINAETEIKGEDE